VVPVAATCHRALRTRPRRREARNCQSPPHVAKPFRIARDNGRRALRDQSPPHVAEPFGLARDNGRRTLAQPVAAACRGAVRTRPRQQEARIVAASRRHMSRSRSDSPATTGGALWHYQSPPHAAEPFRLAHDNGRRALALPIAAARRGAIRTRQRPQEARIGRLAHDNGRRAAIVSVAATCRRGTHRHRPGGLLVKRR